ncbi:hypothetical protein ANN_23249 [Periplaneta americana]|uniref:Uncharacterized protein n=1 Tax=Periplaneta americana TaxID=6978 RepID=A0ABQ8SKM8_PERAM|nr:hypothetical protein ANN_23249 [Periplaneta americana]
MRNSVLAARANRYSTVVDVRRVYDNDNGGEYDNDGVRCFRPRSLAVRDFTAGIRRKHPMTSAIQERAGSVSPCSVQCHGDLRQARSVREQEILRHVHRFQYSYAATQRNVTGIEAEILNDRRIQLRTLSEQFNIGSPLRYEVGSFNGEKLKRRMMKSIGKCCDEIYSIPSEMYIRVGDHQHIDGSDNVLYSLRRHLRKLKRVAERELSPVESPFLWIAKKKIDCRQRRIVGDHAEARLEDSFQSHEATFHTHCSDDSGLYRRRLLRGHFSYLRKSRIWGRKIEMLAKTWHEIGFRSDVLRPANGAHIEVELPTVRLTEPSVYNQSRLKIVVNTNSFELVLSSVCLRRIPISLTRNCLK